MSERSSNLAAGEMIVVPAVPPDESLPPGEWIRKNLFNNWYNALITIVFGVVGVAAIIRGLVWVIDSDYKILRDSLRLFTVGQFPRDELWRLWLSGYLLIAAIGLTAGALGRNAYEDAVEKELPATEPTWPELVRRFWPLGALLVFFTAFAQTAIVYIGTAGVFAAIFITREIGRRAPVAFRSRIVFIGVFFVLASMIVLSGTSGLGGLAFGLLAAVFVASELGQRDLPQGPAGTAVRWGIPAAAGVAVYFIQLAIPLDGFGWDDWGGMHLTLFVTVLGIGLGMPFGILLAMGRQSQLPMIKAASVGFIEFVRGVPLISLLLFSNLMFQFFFPLSMQVPGQLTRAIIVITAFSAAYIAEIVRGGLQSVPQGQTEAAQALGLSPGKQQRLIILPQALRNVIPAMVGQFISLFKDTSLLAIIGVAEFLRASDIANAQTEFVGKGLTSVTYVFVAIGYWAIAYTMSKEARRLETKLGVGVR